MGQKHKPFREFWSHFPCATSAKILAAMYARVPQAMVQFVLKIEKLSHIMAPTPILEMARAYGLHPRLWLLGKHNHSLIHLIVYTIPLEASFSILPNLVPRVFSLAWGRDSQGKDPGNEVGSCLLAFLSVSQMVRKRPP